MGYVGFEWGILGYIANSIICYIDNSDESEKKTGCAEKLPHSLFSTYYYDLLFQLFNSDIFEFYSRSMPEKADMS